MIYVKSHYLCIYLYDDDTHWTLLNNIVIDEHMIGSYKITEIIRTKKQR